MLFHISTPVHAVLPIALDVAAHEVSVASHELGSHELSGKGARGNFEPPAATPSWVDGYYTASFVAVAGHEFSVAGHELAVAGHELAVAGHEFSVAGHEFSVAGHEMSVAGHELSAT